MQPQLKNKIKKYLETQMIHTTKNCKPKSPLTSPSTIICNI